MEGKSPLTDFLQVNINMEKFNLFASTLSSALAAHDRQLQQHSKQLSQLRLTMEDRTIRLKEEIDYEKQRFDKKRKQDDTFFNGVMTDTLKKYDNLMYDSKNRLNDMEERIRKVKGQDYITKYIKEQIGSTMEKHIKEMEQQMALMENNIKEVQKELKKSMTSQDFLLKNVIEAYQKKNKDQSTSQMKVQHKQMIPRSIKPEKSKHHNHHHHHHSPSPVHSPDGKLDSKNHDDKSINIEQATFREAQERRKKKAQEKCEQQNLQYASISAKIDQLQNRLSAKQNQSLNKVIYANRNNPRAGPESSQQGIPMSMDRIELQRKSLQLNITEKLEHIQQIIRQKLLNCDKETDRLKGKIQVLADQVDIALRKFQKERNKAVDISLQLKKIEEKRIDDKVVDNLVTIMKRNMQNLEEQVEKKMERGVWEKQSAKLQDKLTIIIQGMAEKADKDQIRRAFQFVQDKIKDIVMLMAKDAQQEKQGAGKRLPFKCLSCDKDLQNSMPSTQRNNTSSASRLPNRTTSSNLRKRVRAGCMQSH